MLKKLMGHVLGHEYTYILPEYEVPYIKIQVRKREEVSTLEQC